VSIDLNAFVLPNTKENRNSYQLLAHYAPEMLYFYFSKDFYVLFLIPKKKEKRNIH
jgi:hypothetical protein